MSSLRNEEHSQSLLSITSDEEIVTYSYLTNKGGMKSCESEHFAAPRFQYFLLLYVVRVVPLMSAHI